MAKKKRKLRDTSTEDMADIQAYLAGDEKGFTRLHLRHRSWVSSMARAKIIENGGNLAHADDIISYIWLKVVKSLHGFRGDCKFTTWMHTVVNTTYLTQVVREENELISDKARRLQSKRIYEDHTEDYTARVNDADLEYDEANPRNINELSSQYRSSLEDADLLTYQDAWNKTLPELTDREAQMLKMYDDGMDHWQIGYEMGITKSTVLKHFNQAKKKLTKTIIDIQPKEHYE